MIVCSFWMNETWYAQSIDSVGGLGVLRADENAEVRKPNGRGVEDRKRRNDYGEYDTKNMR